MFTATALIDKFRYALTNKWGYIWGTAGILWTDAKQKQKVQYMVTKYGTGWKNNSEAKDDNYYSSALYGDRWIGKYVADCSGLFSWAFKQLGGSIAHGSNSIYNKYCTAKGNLSSGTRTDGNILQPGTAVFTASGDMHNHIGLYVGDGVVIEASGTINGVITTKISNSKWKCWGELKGVNYDAADLPGSETEENPTLRKGSKGQPVTILQGKLIEKGYSCGSKGADGIFGNDTLNAVKQFQADRGLTVDGIVGKNTWAALNTETAKPQAKWFVYIPCDSESEADTIIAKYPRGFKEMAAG